MKILLLDDNLSIEDDALKTILRSNYPEVSILNVVAGSSDDILRDINYWNTIVLYRFSDNPISNWCETFIKKFMEATDNKGTIFPISYGEVAIPPALISHLKANSILAENSLKIISDRVGAFLGLCCIGKEHTLFISYRAKDGKSLAIQVEEVLKRRGFNTWRDEARDKDQEGSIVIGQDAQDVIERNLERCTAIILIDTPLVTESDWVKKEIEMANARLIPILPICFRVNDDHNKGPRFRTLRNLSRWLDVQGDLTEEDKIVDYLEKFLLDIYKRKKELPGLLEQAFKTKGYSWLILDPKKLYFSSSKALVKVVKNILSHSPIHHGLYPPYISQFSKYTPGGSTHYNFRVLIYDGELVPQDDLEKIKTETGAQNIEIFHHQDIEILLEQI